MISSGKVDLVVNTPRGRGPRADGDHIRRTATAHRVSCVTTVAAAVAAASGLAEWATSEPQVRSLQEYHRDHQLRLEV
jgi:carbamoyl-phosphate synthase large subunit